MSTIVPWELELLHIKDNKCCFAEKKKKKQVLFFKCRTDAFV